MPRKNTKVYVLRCQPASLPGISTAWRSASCSEDFLSHYGDEQVVQRRALTFRWTTSKPSPCDGGVERPIAARPRSKLLEVMRATFFAHVVGGLDHSSYAPSTWIYFINSGRQDDEDRGYSRYSLVSSGHTLSNSLIRSQVFGPGRSRFRPKLAYLVPDLDHAIDVLMRCATMDQKSWKTLHYFVKGMCAQGTLCNLPVKYAQLLLGAKMGMGIKVLLLIACVTTPHLIPWSGLVKMFVTSSTSRKQYWGTHYPFFDVGDYETERRANMFLLVCQEICPWLAGNILGANMDHGSNSNLSCKVTTATASRARRSSSEPVIDSTRPRRSSRASVEGSHLIRYSRYSRSINSAGGISMGKTLAFGVEKQLLQSRVRRNM
ncbi:hypothetical protein BDZ88DRAFT_408417 [Geranomyces variabilis]|nr:hypothetical protein BDZ88DRAFT_408417 [Geranomyces variabilis]